MERKLVSIQEVAEIKPIEGADKIVAARVNDWWLVTGKDNFKVGDLCVFYEIDSFLPDLPLYEFLKKGSSLKRMAVGGEIKVGIRLKTIKLRGQISQGLILPLYEVISNADDLGLKVGDDLTQTLGVIKYEPPVPADLTGTVKGFFPGFIPKTDEERIQNMGDVLTGFYVTEKLDGTSVTYYKKDGVIGVCTRNLELKEGDGTQWRLAREMNLAEKLPEGFAIQGELVGEGIQGNPYKIKGQKVYFFNAYKIENKMYLSFNDFMGFMAAIPLETVPVLDIDFSLPKTVAEMLAYAEGKSVLADTEREGVVVRPKREMEYNGQRLSFKAISNKYLLGEE